MCIIIWTSLFAAAYPKLFFTPQKEEEFSIHRILMRFCQLAVSAN